MLNSWLITLLVFSRFYPKPKFWWSKLVSLEGPFLECNKNNERSPATGSPKEQWHRWTRHRSWWPLYIDKRKTKRNRIFPKGKAEFRNWGREFQLGASRLKALFELIWWCPKSSAPKHVPAIFWKLHLWALTDFHPTVESTLGACKYSLNELQYSDCEEETTCRRWMLEHRLSEEVEQQQLGQYPGIS